MTAWWIGLGIGFGAVAAIVAVVAAILATASRIAVQAERAARIVDEARVATLPLWDLERANEAARGVLEALRERASGGGSRS